RSIEWMSQQLYLGGKLLKNHCKVSLFNAFVKREIKKCKENGYHFNLTLAVVSQEARESQAWKDLSVEDKEKLMEYIEDNEVLALPLKVTAQSINADIEGTLSHIQPEIVGLEQCTGCNIMWIVTCGKVGDVFAPRSYASESLQTACLHLFKTTVEKFALQADGYVVSGAARVVNMTTGHTTTKLKADMREMVCDGMNKLLTNAKNIEPHKLPAVAYNSYESFIAKWGIELTGWTEARVVNPGNITSSVALGRLHAALKSSDCYWHELMPTEWKSQKD
ncbi:hypothetical protein EV702DRAFT_952308, partial [Suillus placidus]